MREFFIGDTIVMVYIVIGGLGALAMIILFACEIHENNKRIENGEPPIRHHDMASASGWLMNGKRSRESLGRKTCRRCLIIWSAGRYS